MKKLKRNAFSRIREKRFSPIEVFRHSKTNEVIIITKISFIRSRSKVKNYICLSVITRFLEKINSLKDFAETKLRASSRYLPPPYFEYAPLHRKMELTECIVSNFWHSSLKHRDIITESPTISLIHQASILVTKL